MNTFIQDTSFEYLSFFQFAYFGEFLGAQRLVAQCLFFALMVII